MNFQLPITISNTEQGIRRGGGITKEEVKYELPLTINH